MVINQQKGLVEAFSMIVKSFREPSFPVLLIQKMLVALCDG